MSDNISLVLLSSFAASTDIILHIVLGMPSCSQIIGRSSRFPACRLCLLSTVLLARVVPSAPSFQPAIASLSRPSSVLVDTSSGQPPAAALGSSCPNSTKKINRDYNIALCDKRDFPRDLDHSPTLSGPTPRAISRLVTTEEDAMMRQQSCHVTVCINSNISIASNDIFVLCI